MMGQNILCGYLTFKPTGSLSVFRPAKKQWYVYNDAKCQLYYYKNETESRYKAHLGIIKLQQAAITLHLEELNHFVIHSEKKEYHLIAEGHELMMRWVTEIQTRRDYWNSKFGVLFDEKNQSNVVPQQIEVGRSNESLPSEHEMLLMLEKAKTAEHRLRVTRGNSFPLDFYSATTPANKSKKDRLCKSTTSIPRDADKAILRYTSGNLSMDGKVLNSDIRVRTYSVPEVPSENRPEAAEEEPLEFFLPTEECDSSVSSDSAVCTSECHHTVRLHEMEEEIRITNSRLAETLSREAAYKSTMERLESMVEELEDRLSLLQNGFGFWNLGGERTLTCFHKLEEKCQVLKNHTIFLNDEVLKLSRILQQEQYQCQTKEFKVQEVKNDMEKLKRDYVFLLLSSIRIYCGEGPEITEIYLYGGTRHKTRVLALLEEARKVNDALPTYESLSTSISHIDSMGFEHKFIDESFILHYVCSLLYAHYNFRLHSYKRHLVAWKDYCKQNEDFTITKALKGLIRKGIPNHLRKTVWRQLYRIRVQDIMKDKGPYYYKTLLNMIPESQVLLYHNRQITLDLLRTIPNNVRFSTRTSDGVKKLQEVLLAFCLHNPTLGYCQGMNFLVGMCLLIMEPEDAFWCLIAITEKYFPLSYFDQSLIGAQADQEVLKDLLKEKMPALYRHLVDLDIDLRTITLNWFMAIFFDSVPFETLLRIWDCFLSEGPKVLFRFTLAILKIQEEAILKKQDTVSIMRQLKAAAKFCYDVDELMKVAFEDFHPFPRRSDIATKQTCYTKALRDVLRRKEQRRQSLSAMMPEFDWKLTTTSGPNIDSAVVFDNDKLWLAFFHANGSQMAKINADEGIMYKLNLQCDSRVMCMHSVGSDMIILGTVSHIVQVYNIKTRKLLAEVKLNDLILCLLYNEDDGVNFVYAGLADGTLAVIENICASGKKAEVFYIFIGYCPVSCLLQLERRLLCTCGNRIVIMNSRTLDAIDQFQITNNDLDHIATMIPSEYGIWTSIRGSSALQLWDTNTLTCKLVYDIQYNSYNSFFKNEDIFRYPMRITSILPIDNGIVVGTSDGSLLVYSVLSRKSRQASIADSSKQEFYSESASEMTEYFDGTSTEDKSTGILFLSDTLTEGSSVLSLPLKTSRNSIFRRLSAPVIRSSSPSSYKSSNSLPEIENNISEWCMKMNEANSMSSVDLRQACGIYGLQLDRPGRKFTTIDDSQMFKCDDGNTIVTRHDTSTLSSSLVSFSSCDTLYGMELIPKEKIKACDKPIKCLFKVKCGEENYMITCAGNYGEEEAVMKWTKEGDEMLWTSEYVLDICPQEPSSKNSTIFGNMLLSAAKNERKLSISINMESTGLSKVHTLFSSFR